METLKMLRERAGHKQTGFAGKLGITKQTLYAWESGKTPVALTRWQMYAKALGVTMDQLEDAMIETILAYALRTFDPSPIITAQKTGRFNPVKLANANRRLMDYINDPGDVAPVSSPSPLKVPVIGFAAAAECNTSVYPIAEWAQQCADEWQAFPLAKEGDFCLTVSGSSMLPWYPAGTRLLCRPHQRPTNGQRVIAVLGDGEVVFKIFAEKGGRIFLFSINDDDGRDFDFDRNDYGAIRAIYTVIESMRDEAALDRAMSEGGIRHRWQDKLEGME